MRVPSALSLATLRAGQILDWSSADKVALLVLSPVPLVAAAFARVHDRAGNLGAEPMLEPAWFDRLDGLLIATLAIQLAFVPLWLVVRRDRRESRGFVASAMAVFLAILSLGGFLVGPVTTPILGALLATLCAVALLFETTLAAWISLGGIVAYFAPLLLVAADVVPYAPVFRPGPLARSGIASEWVISTTIFALGITVVPTVLLGVVVRRWRSRDAALLELARLDPLTHVANRRYFFDRLQVELERSRRHESKLALMLLDLDFFKRVNDRYGHLTGDSALVHVSEMLRLDVLRRIDLVGRYGGEEFAVLLPETDLDGALAVAERCRAAIASRPCPRKDGESIPLTVSIGVVVPRPGEGSDGIIRRVDEALYEAKSTGRNRVVALP